MIKKLIKVLNIALFITLFLFINVEAQENWAEEGLLVFEKCEVSEMDVEALVIAPVGGYWLGCSFKDPQGKWHDLEAQKTYFNEPLHTFTWTAPEAGKYFGTVALWKKRVSARECARKNKGEPCIYCQRNGYHLEDEIARRNFTFTIEVPLEISVTASGLEIGFEIAVYNTKGYLKVSFSDEENNEYVVIEEHYFTPDSNMPIFASWRAPTAGKYQMVVKIFNKNGELLKEESKFIEVEE